MDYYLNKLRKEALIDAQADIKAPMNDRYIHGCMHPEDAENIVLQFLSDDPENEALKERLEHIREHRRNTNEPFWF